MRNVTDAAWRRRDLVAFKTHLGEFEAAVKAEIEAYHAWRQEQ